MEAREASEASKSDPPFTEPHSKRNDDSSRKLLNYDTAVATGEDTRAAVRGYVSDAAAAVARADPWIRALTGADAELCAATVVHASMTLNW